MDGTYCVYKHTAPNGKVYIGITCRNPEKRFQNGKGYKNNPHFNNAIKKYGWENINHSILENGLSREEAMELEKKYIAKYCASDTRYGYNMTLGGESGAKHTEYVKNDISQKLKKYYSAPERRAELSKRNLGKHHSEETKKKMSESHKNMSDEKRARIIASLIGRKCPNRIGHPHTEETKKTYQREKTRKTFRWHGKRTKGSSMC